MPPKPTEQVKGSGAEWYNIDFDPEILKQGPVVATAKVIKGEDGRESLYSWMLGPISLVPGLPRNEVPH